MGVKSFTVPESPMPVANKYREYTGDYGVISDTHFPYHNREVIEGFLNTCHAQGVKRFAIVGDLNDNGMFHEREFGIQAEYLWQSAIDLGGSVLKVFLDVFDNGFVLQGNHDKWLNKAMKGHASPSWLMGRLYSALGSRVTFEDGQTAVVYNEGQKFMLTHGSNYSAANPVGVAKKLASKFHCHVIMGHQYHPEQGQDVSGDFQAVVIGGAHDQSRFNYAHEAPRTNPMQGNSFAIIKEGFAQVYNRTPSGEWK